MLPGLLMMSVNNFLILMRKNNLVNLIIDILAFAAVLLMFGYVGVDAVMVALLIIAMPYLVLTKRKHLIGSLFIAFIISVVWKLIGGKYYHYGFNKLILFGVNLYPIFLWTFGLFIVALVFHDINRFIKRASTLTKFLIFSSLFWFGLLLAEWVVYNIFGIKNLATASYSGIPFLNCIHAPLWMQISYFLMGPIYFILLKLFKSID